MRRLVRVASSHKDLISLPEAVQSNFGLSLYLAEYDEKLHNAKPLIGFDGACVLEVVANVEGDTCRASYIVRFGVAVYVLHVFQKKFKSAIATSKQEMDLVRTRLRAAELEYAQRQE
jgi:phage-related protein